MSDQQQNSRVIMFVDDNVDTVQDHRDRLTEETGHQTYLCASVDAAVRYLNKHHGKVCLAVIDLYIPNNWQSLESYVTKNPGGLKANHGQLLGMYLDEMHNNIPFVYLSAVTSAYFGDNERIKKAFRKKSDDMNDFIKHCTKLLKGSITSNE